MILALGLRSQGYGCEKTWATHQRQNFSDYPPPPTPGSEFKLSDRLKFDRQLMLPVKFQRDAMIQTTNLAASRLHEISQ